LKRIQLLVFAVLVLAVSGCGGSKQAVSPLSKEANAACNGSPLSKPVRLPATWPKMGSVTFTRQETLGPTEIVEGYFNGDVKKAHDEFKRELEAAGYTILFDELEARDSEVAWKHSGRSGQVAMRLECGTSDKTYVKITNRAA
jgi:hypothetical protein